jgi:hypothetical protein
MLPRKVLFVTDNGHGLGHISRVVAIAKQHEHGINPFLLTLSEGFPIGSWFGIPTEYFPSARRLGLRRSEWSELLRIRIIRTLDRIRPSLVVIDHVNPPRVVLHAARAIGIPTVWVRRGLWRSGHLPRGAQYAHLFDFILEPLDLATAFDRGATPRLPHKQLHYVRPISIIERDEMLDREEARRALGLPSDRFAILLNLSADTTAALVRLITRIRDHALQHRAAVLFTPLHILHAHQLPAIDSVIMRPVYPLARYLAAFDAAISTAGYNAFHELVLAQTPCIFMARETDSLDDQALRARTASLGGFGVHVEATESAGFTTALLELLDPVLAARMREAAGYAHPGNGAVDAGRLVSSWATGLGDI